MVWTCAEEGQQRLAGGCSRPKRRFIDVVRGDMQIIGMGEDTEDRERWERIIHWGNSKKKKSGKAESEELKYLKSYI